LGAFFEKAVPERVKLVDELGVWQIGAKGQSLLFSGQPKFTRHCGSVGDSFPLAVRFAPSNSNIQFTLP
jgi:hypothetical protein